MQGKEIYLGPEHSIAIPDFIAPVTDEDKKVTNEQAKGFLSFVSQGIKLEKQFGEIMRKHGVEDEPLYAELCKEFEQFHSFWGVILAGKIGEDLREFIRWQEERNNEYQSRT